MFLKNRNPKGKVKEAKLKRLPKMMPAAWRLQRKRRRLRDHAPSPRGQGRRPRPPHRTLEAELHSWLFGADPSDSTMCLLPDPIHQTLDQTYVGKPSTSWCPRGPSIRSHLSKKFFRVRRPWAGLLPGPGSGIRTWMTLQSRLRRQTFLQGSIERCHP